MGRRAPMGSLGTLALFGLGAACLGCGAGPKAREAPEARPPPPPLPDKEDPNFDARRKELLEAGLNVALLESQSDLHGVGLHYYSFHDGGMGVTACDRAGLEDVARLVTETPGIYRMEWDDRFRCLDDGSDCWNVAGDGRETRFIYEGGTLFAMVNRPSDDPDPSDDDARAYAMRNRHRCPLLRALDAGMEIERLWEWHPPTDVAAAEVVRHCGAQAGERVAELVARLASFAPSRWTCSAETLCHYLSAFGSVPEHDFHLREDGVLYALVTPAPRTEAAESELERFLERARDEDPCQGRLQ